MAAADSSVSDDWSVESDAELVIACVDVEWSTVDSLVCEVDCGS